jgi:phosphohistidine swiveling domain-containing protein
LKQALMYYRFKTITLKIGGVLVKNGTMALPDDVFFLQYKEIVALLSHSDMFSQQYKEIIALRKKAFSVQSQQKFPDNFFSFFGEEASPELMDLAAIASDAQEFSGLSACGGKIKGCVKVLDSVLEAGKINKGDILVTRQTDPGWAMVFPLISGLIVERGGALSHGAIVAREFGIPAVVGIENITKILKDNDQIILDGDAGKIFKLA